MELHRAAPPCPRTGGRSLRALRRRALVALGALLLAGCSVRAPGAGGGTTGPTTEPSGVVTTAPEPSEARQSPAPTETAAPSPSPSVTPPPEPAPAPEEPRSWRLGDEGPAVLALQERLIDLGYFLPAADGDFGPATQQAVWALQKAAGLARDGLVGPDTQAALDAGVRPAARTSTGRVLEVDLRRQLVLAVDDGVVTRAVNASTGTGETFVALGDTYVAVTPKGDWSVVWQIDGMHESGLELGEMYRPKYFYKGWAVHGSSSVPPWPASHGCVRVSHRAMDWIWDVWGAPLGTRVLVY